MLQPEPEDMFRPRPMPAALTLYRSVSIPELADIWRRGIVAGGRNLFSVDYRDHVFFADEIDDRLIRQGEDLGRQTCYALRHHFSERLVIEQLIENQADLILDEMDRDRIGYDRERVWDFRDGDEESRFRRAAFCTPGADRLKYTALFRAFRQLLRKLAALDHDHAREYETKLLDIDTRVAANKYSSAILVTHPISGGLLYSTEHGFSGHGDREYGFRAGQVRFEHLAEVVLIKAGEEVGRCWPWQIGGILRNLSPSLPHKPAEPANDRVDDHSSSDCTAAQLRQSIG